MPNDVPDWTLSFTQLAGELTVADLKVTGLAGAATVSRYVGAVSGVAPTSGTFSQGDYVVDLSATHSGFWVCTVGGTPGTWVFVKSGNWDSGMTMAGDLTLFVSGSQRLIEIDNDSSASFAGNVLRYQHTAGALPNSGHERWVARTVRPGATGVASNTRYQLYRANTAETILQEYFRVGEDGVIHLADGVVVTVGAPSPGLAGVQVGFLLIDSTATSLASSKTIRHIGAWTTAGPPTGIVALAGDLGSDGNNTPWICTVAGTPGTWRRVDGLFAIGASLVGTAASINDRLFTQEFSAAGTTDASGNLAISFPTAFPNKVVNINATVGDNAASLGMVQVIQSTVTVSGFTAGCLNNLGNPINTLAVRVNVHALGG